ncbi:MULTISPECIES: TonB-dependent siderophore receptor [Kamptonema]|uniref:TonB-dependent siderophore receptor n=1 Tax=Kamptonema TaxID=1501433 RepID=UPI0011D2C727|nr:MULTISPECIES: TonB-dependent siderophore receptor [Kamptonema]
MKLSLPFFCVALLGVGIMPVAAAGPRSFSEGTNLDRTEVEPAIAPDPSSINRSKEDDRAQWWAIASASDREKPIEQKPSSQSEELEVKLAIENLDRKPNSDLTLDPEYNRDRAAPTPNIEPTAQPKEPTAEIPKLDEIEQHNTNVEGFFQRSQASFTFSENVQISQSVVQVTGVQLNPTPAGLEVILETAAGQVLRANTRTSGTTLIAEISNAQLALPGGGEFKAENPFEGITSVTVTNVDANSIRISITGQERLPIADVIRSASGLTLSVTADEEINITVTARQATPYLAPNASTATRTDTPIRDVPQSIQVIPQEVIEDQQAIRAEDALRNVSGITFDGGGEGQGLSIAIRGFSNAPVLTNGFREYGAIQGSELLPDTANIERIEVLKGPASILFGEVQPGGVINVVTKLPLSTPFYEGEVQLGNYGFARPRLDISGPLTSDGSLLYRLNAVYEHSEGFRDFDQDIDRVLVAPVITWKISDRTDFTVLLQYSDIQQPLDFGRIAVGDRLLDTPRRRIFGEPDDSTKIQLFTVGYDFEHRFSDNWKFRNAFRYSDRHTEQRFASFPFTFDEATGIAERYYGGFDLDSKNYSLQTNIVGNFATGSVKHTLLAGVDLNRLDDEGIGRLDFGLPTPLNVFDPVYGSVPRPEFQNIPGFFDQKLEVNRIGVYLQDQIAVLDNLKLLAGIRYDTVEQTIGSLEGFFRSTDVKNTETNDAFTPRVGIVYQPIPEISLYGSYSRSFLPVTATSADGSLLAPEEGEGFEFGLKTELFQNRLSATLAYFDITKKNVATTDPNDSFFSIATGEQRSRGVELDLSGEILPGWNIIGGYAYTDAEVTKDNAIEVGNRLIGVPKHSASMWTTYTIQTGELQGLGFGIGFNYVGEREGDLDNSFQLDSYFLTDAAIFYRRDNWRFAINVKNIFNTDYSPGTPNGRTRIEVGEPLRVIGSFSVQF